jgi:hypothetical protein
VPGGVHESFPFCLHDFTPIRDSDFPRHFRVAQKSLVNKIFSVYPCQESDALVSRIRRTFDATKTALLLFASEARKFQNQNMSFVMAQHVRLIEVTDPLDTAQLTSHDSHTHGE